MYDYIKKVYKVNPVVGRKVIKRDSGGLWGTVSRIPKLGSDRYVWVKIHDEGRPIPYHPWDLDYFKPDIGRRDKDLFEPRPDEKEVRQESHAQIQFSQE